MIKNEKLQGGERVDKTSINYEVRRKKNDKIKKFKNNLSKQKIAIHFPKKMGVIPECQCSGNAAVHCHW